MKITKKEQKRLEKKEKTRKDKAWAILVKERDKACVICGEIKRLNAHHIIPREVKETRWLLENGVSLCPGCHKFRVNSAHRNPLWFFAHAAKRINNLVEVLCERGIEVLE